MKLQITHKGCTISLEMRSNATTSEICKIIAETVKTIEKSK